MIGAGLVMKGRQHRRVLATAVVSEAAAALNEVLADLGDLLERLGHDLAFVAARAGVAKPAAALEVVPADLVRDVPRGVEVPGVVVCMVETASTQSARKECPGKEGDIRTRKAPPT